MKSKLLIIISGVFALALVGSSYVLATGGVDITSLSFLNTPTLTPTPTTAPTLSPTPSTKDQENPDVYVYPSPMPTERVDIPENGNPAFGKKDAPIYMVEYVDYECPKCAEFHNKYFDLLKRDYIDTGKMRFVIKDFPLSGHRRARMTADIANCVYRLNGITAYEGFIDKVFKNQDEWVQAENVLWAQSAYTKELGVDVDKLQSCFKKKPDSENIDADEAEARSFGLIGTPSFFVNGKPIIGVAPTYEDLVGAIEDLKSDK